MKDLTLYELMGDDFYVFAKVKDIPKGNTLVEVEVLNDKDERVFYEITHPYAWESLVSFAKQVLQLNKHIEKKLEQNS